MKCVTYTRVSSKEQEKEGYSIPAQEKLLAEYASRNGFTVVKGFSDVETAKRAGRTEFNKMLEFLKANPEVNHLLCEKTDRLYRNIKDWACLDDENLSVHLVKENEVLSEDSRSHQKLVHGVKVLLAKNFLDNLSEETKKGMKEKAEQGMWPTNAPLGYKNSADDKGKKIIVPDPATAPFVKRGFELYAKGNISLLELTRTLRTEGFRRGKKQQPIPKSSIARMLANRVYTGEFEFKGKLYKGNYEPLISMDVFDTVQMVSDNRLNGSRKRQKHNFAYSGLIKCAVTGGHLIGELKKGKYILYRATRAKGVPYVNQEELDLQFSENLKRLRFDKEICDWVCQALRESKAEHEKFQEEALARHNKNYQQLENRINQMYLDKLDGVITQDFFDEKASLWRAEQKQILRHIEQLQDASQHYIEDGIRLLHLARNAHELFLKQDDTEKRKLLDIVTSNCTWGDGVLTVEFKQPFKMLDNFIQNNVPANDDEAEEMPISDLWGPRPCFTANS